MVIPALPISEFNSSSLPASRSQRIAPPIKLCSDYVLIRAQEGDSDAFSQLYSRHKKRVFAICMGMVRDFSLAEDLTQETFLQLHRKLASFRGDSLFTTWLHRITVNVVLMRLRKRVLPVLQLDQMMTNLPEELAGQSFGGRDRRQTDVVDRIAIERAVDTLPPGCRKVFLLHDVLGLQHREIASKQGCSVGNSKSQLHNARRVLRNTLSSPTRREPSTKEDGKNVCLDGR